MITAVSLNPSIDRTLELTRLEVGGLNRIEARTDAAAGKGVNVALAAAALGEAAECVGLMYRDGDALFKERLSRAGVGCEFLRCEGAVRVNTKVFDRARGEITELNASGVPVTMEQLEAVKALILRRARTSDFLVLTGSLPPQCPADFYRMLILDAAPLGCRVILDADGERLRQGLKARPFLIKPNRHELEALMGRSLDSPRDLPDAAAQLARGGIGIVAVSLGSEGALITDGRRALRTPGARVDVRSTVGAGDSMIAGLAVGFARGADLEEAFRLGVAAATARCAAPPDEPIDCEYAERLAKELRVEEL